MIDIVPGNKNRQRLPDDTLTNIFTRCNFLHRHKTIRPSCFEIFATLETIVTLLGGVFTLYINAYLNLVTRALARILAVTVPPSNTAFSLQIGGLVTFRSIFRSSIPRSKPSSR